MIESCFYEGTVRHRRRQPGVDFTQSLALAYIDLDELPGLLGGRLIRRGFGPLRFRRSDYLGDPGTPLDEAVRSLVNDHTGRRPTGPIRILTQLRSFGTCFNPVSFYYCFDAEGERLETMVAEVTNTPWGGRHAYVVGGDGSAGPVLTGSFDKALHVSPFMSMDHTYTCRAVAPGETVSVHIESTRNGQPAFDATLGLRRRELSRATVVRTLTRYPLASVRVLALIYGRALQLKLSGAPYFPPPQADAT